MLHSGWGAPVVRRLSGDSAVPGRLFVERGSDFDPLTLGYSRPERRGQQQQQIAEEDLESMAEKGGRKSVPALGWWLMLVGSLRLASVWFGFFNIWALRVAVFSQTEMTEIHGRTFGVWTLLTCTLCFLCAFNLENKPLYIATFLSFIYALGHFLTEYLIYHTMAAANLGTVGFFAGTSIVWMLLQWNSHGDSRGSHAVKQS